LFRKAEMKAMVGNMRNCALKTVVLPCGSSFLIICPYDGMGYGGWACYCTCCRNGNLSGGEGRTFAI
jgi:hypothetical protein